MTNDNKLLSTAKKVASKISALPKQLTRKGSTAPNATSNNNSAMTATEQTKHSKIKHSSEQQNEPSSTGRVRIRLIPVWLRVILVLCLLIIVVVVGLMFGYSVLGDGKAMDVLKWDTWQHIIDIIRGVE